jgi:hypothetical protein
MTHRSLRSLLAASTILSATACGDSLGPVLEAREIGVVVNSTEISLTTFDVSNPEATRTVGLAPDGSPVSVATRGRLAAVPLGIVPAVAIVDLIDAELRTTAALPEGSGATGALFLTDSTLLVANPSLNSLSLVHARAGLVGDPIDVGVYPQALVAARGLVFVVEANLESFAPAGPSSLTVLDPETLQVVDRITLSGQNASAATVGPDGTVYVVHSGNWGQGDGSVSIVDPVTRTERAHVEGFGDFPGSIAVDAAGRVHVGSFAVGTMVWDSATEGFLHSPEAALEPGGVASTSGLGFDVTGRLYTLTPDCQQPGRVNRLSSTYDLDVTIAVGVCPFAIAFTEVEGIS